VTRVDNPDRFIREKFSDRTPYLIFYVKITKPVVSIENMATQISVTTTNELTVETTDSSNNEYDTLNDALIDDEMESNEGEYYKIICYF
jgi:hypothetical protein